MKTDVINTKTHMVVSDPGVDDIIALLLLTKLAEEQKHMLVSTFGNAPEKCTAKNAKEFVAFAAPHWFFANGPENPVKPLDRPWPDYYHGPDGVCGIHPIVDIAGVKSLEKSTTAESIISLGPMTGVYDILRLGKVESITVMGGAIRVPGNETSYAETNIAFDPEAAEYVFSHVRGVSVNVIPLDVSKLVFWTKDDIAQIPEDKPHTAWVRKMLITWFESYGGKRESVFHLHDPLAIYSMYFPDSLQWTSSGIRVVTDGQERGRTVLDNANSPCEVALGINNPIHIARTIFEIIFSSQENLL